MIKASELKIGNCLKVSGSGTIVVINSILPDCVNQIITRGQRKEVLFIDEIKLESLTPIPLTPEILRQAGFLARPKAEGPLFTKDRFEIDLENGCFIYEWNKRDTHPGRMATRFWYVHEIQNLYFALTGEELPIANCFVTPSVATT